MSSPKEKAEEIFNKMYNCELDISYYAAKQCALIAVDEILEALEEYDERTENYLKKDFPNYFSSELQNMEQDLRYWQDVKKEIEKL
jgi:hypothetical protein